MKLAISSKRLVLMAIVVAGFVVLLSILDLALKFPFNGAMMMDILFAISASITAYLGWEAFREIE
ncbi:MAG: hypothetical protein U0903_03250 [Planctomycetales bacterium]